MSKIKYFSKLNYSWYDLIKNYCNKVFACLLLRKGIKVGYLLRYYKNYKIP